MSVFVLWTKLFLIYRREAVGTKRIHSVAGTPADLWRLPSAVIRLPKCTDECVTSPCMSLLLVAGSETPNVGLTAMDGPGVGVQLTHRRTRPIGVTRVLQFGFKGS